MFLIYIICFSIILSIVAKFNSNINIIVSNYEIYTNTSFVFIVFLLVFLFGFLINYILDIRSLNKKNRSEKMYKKYIDNIYNIIIYSVSNQNTQSNSYLIKNKKIMNNKLNDLLDSFVNKNDNIKINNFNNYIKLNEAVANKDNDKIKELVNIILQTNKKDIYCNTLLYKINKEENNWLECLKLVKNLDKNYIKEELPIIYKNLAMEYFENNDLEKSFKYSKLYFKYNQQDENNNEILIASTKNKRLIKKFSKIIRKNY